MECAEIRPRLSEYLDDVLDVQTKSLVKKHLSECVECREALESLQALVQGLGDLRPVKPPDDFLKQLHGRMAKQSRIKELRKMLFVPFQGKIPLRLATAAAMGVLIFFIIRTPEIEKKRTEMPKQEAILEGVEETDRTALFESSREKEILAPAPASKASPSGKPPYEEQDIRVPKKAAPLRFASKSKRTATIPEVNNEEEFHQKPSTMKAVPKQSVTDGGETIELVLLLKPKDESGPEASTRNELVSRLKDLLYDVKGVVLSAEYDLDTGSTISLNAQIPAGQYGIFCKELQKLGPLQSPPPSINLKGPEHIIVLIHIIRP